MLACQLMQLKGGSESDAQAYVGGVLDQARVPNGRSLDDGGWWMDVAPQRVRDLVKILDTERRRILRRLGARPLTFNAAVRYSLDGPVLAIEGVARGYYDRARVRVTVRREASA